MAGKKREPLKDKEKIRQGREEFQDIKEFAKRYIGPSQAYYAKRGIRLIKKPKRK